MRADVKLMGLALALAGSSLFAGCARSIHIMGIGDVRRRNVHVDVVGVNWVEKQQWEALSKLDYWSDSNQRRKDSIDQGYNRAVMFTPGSSCEITIKQSDPLWKNWKRRKATHLLIMFDTCPDDQAWRLCLPLSPKCWRGRAAKRTIEVTIQPSGVVPKTAPKAKCKG